MKAEEMELSLELSIGGCYKNIGESRKHENRNGKIHEIDGNNTSSKSDVSENYGVGCVQDEIFCSNSADHRKRREMQALRRREAIMKREEKQKQKQKRWAKSKGGVNERVYLEMEKNQAKGVDRGKRENESSQEFLMKRAKGNSPKSNIDGVGYNKCLKVIQNGNDCGNRMVSNGLVQRSSSAIFDYQSTAQKAKSSSTDTGSHSNYSQGGQQQSSTTATSNTPERSDFNGPSSHARSDQANATGKTATLVSTMSSSDIPPPECSNSRKCEPINKPTPTPQEQTSSASRLCNESAIKNPIPQRNNPNISPLPRMPLVSTTGNGPNGKTVNGFLYSYSKSEVNIVCVCHGSSFSPAKFVEHAGGIAVSHPLKHITVVPTPFG